MNLYLDTSALVKIWIEEPQSAEIRARVAQADHIGASTVAHAELGATLARLEREGRLASASRTVILDDFARQWTTMHRVVAGPMISRQAAELARAHALRGFDAIHLASAIRFRKVVGPALFLSFDGRLNVGARAEGFALT